MAADKGYFLTLFVPITTKYVNNSKMNAPFIFRNLFELEFGFNLIPQTPFVNQLLGSFTDYGKRILILLSLRLLHKLI